jgi:uncharacterized protein (DUF1810 family)
VVKDAFDLDRFVQAQERTYPQVLRELSDGRKTSHWMWFVFPQLRGLGHSTMSHRYGIGSLAEARAYLAHPLLGPRLMQCAALTLRIEGRSIDAIFGSPDDMKFRSCMTLFGRAADDRTCFDAALQKYFAGRPDLRTLELLAAENANDSSDAM